MAMKRVRILNCAFDPLTLQQAVDGTFDMLNAGRRGWIATVNVSILMMMRADARLQSFVDRASMVVADGQPLIWSAPWLDHPLPERVTGVDLVGRLCERAALEGKGIFLLGATKDVVGNLEGKLRERNPGLDIASADGYFSMDDAAARADTVRASGADILFVGMGVPRQEQFIEENWERLGVGVAIGVGGSFDVLAGLRARAPVWIRRIGMEWFFRMVQEPRRLFLRYFVTNNQFIALVLHDLMMRKVLRRGARP